MQSPLTDFCAVLKRVKKTADVHRGQLQRREALTRVALVDPLIRSLGWDTSNPDMVEVEKNVGAGMILDYLLNAPKPIIIEAKKLNESFENHFVQIVGYAFNLGAESLFITDGLKWYHYTNFSSANKEPVRKIDLGNTTDSDLPKEAAYIIEHLDAALFAKTASSESVEDELRGRIDELEKMIIEVEGTVSCLMEGKVAPPIIKPELEPWLVLGDGSWDPKGRRPKKLRLPDNSEVAVAGWSKVLTEICTYCLTKKPELLDPLPILDKAGRNTKLVDTISSTGNCAQVTINDQVYFVNVLYSASASVANAVYMLEKLGEGTASKTAVLLAE